MKPAWIDEHRDLFPIAPDVPSAESLPFGLLQLRWPRALGKGRSRPEDSTDRLAFARRVSWHLRQREDRPADARRRRIGNGLPEHGGPFYW